MFNLFEYPKSLTLYLLAFYLIVRHIRKKHSGYRLPPGPKGYPIVGNLFDIGGESPWISYSNLAKRYGDIIYVEALGTKILVLSSLKRTTDLLEARSSIYSDRPIWPMLVGHMGYDTFFGFRPYGPDWRKQRKAFHQHYNPLVVSRYHPAMAHEVVQYLKDIESSPAQFVVHTQVFLNRIIMKTAYGIDVMDKDDPYVTMMAGVSEGFSLAGIPGSFLVDLIPALKFVPEWVPGTGWKRTADYYRRKVSEARNVPFQDALRKWQAGQADPCLSSRLIEALPPREDSRRKEAEDDASALASTVYFGGSDTSMGTALTFILVMAMHPEVQLRAQAEIDTVIGSERLPGFEDRPSLVYLNALIKELFRWHQLAPLGVPHATNKDDIYEGYFIPKGTLVMGNTWHILHDDRIFRDPFKFNPERYIEGGKINTNVVDPSSSFGYGRRICPGRHTALDSLYIMFASILATFDIAPSKDAEGNSTLKGTFSGTLLMLPDPFDCIITPRSALHKDLIVGL